MGRCFLIIIFLLIWSICSAQEKASKTSFSIVEKIRINSEMSIAFCKERSLSKKIIFVVSKFCPHCQKSRPILEKVINNNKLKQYYTCLDLANSEDRMKLSSYGLEVIYTPTLIINCGASIGSKSEKEYGLLIERFKNELKNRKH